MCRVLLVFSVLECIVNVPALHGMSLDVCKLERFVPVPHTAVWLLKWDSLSLSLSLWLSVSLSLSLSLISPLSITFLPLINARGMCGRSRCVCECATEIMDVLSCGLCVSAASACVCVCAYQIGHALISHAVLSLNWRAVYDRGWC